MCCSPFLFIYFFRDVSIYNSFLLGKCHVLACFHNNTHSTHPSGKRPQTNNPYPLAILKSFQSVILNINSKSRFQTKNCDLHHHQSHTYFYPKQHQKQTTYLAGALNHKTAHNKGKNVSISRSR